MSPGVDRYGRPWGDPFYGADYGAERVAKTVDPKPSAAADPDRRLLAQLVKRVSRLEAESRRSMTFESGIGNARWIGGNQVTLPTWDTEATSYADLGGDDVTRKVFTKRAADTDLVVVWWWDGFRVDATSSGGAGSFTTETGIEIDSSDNGAKPYRWNANSDHRIVSGFTAIAGVGSGSRSVQIRVRNVEAGHSLETNNSGQAGFLVFELPASLSFS